MERLNCEFKNSLGNFAGQHTKDTVERHGQFTGSFGLGLDTAFQSRVVENTLYKQHTRKPDQSDDLRRLVKLLLPQNLFDHIPGRYHKAFPAFQYVEGTTKPEKLKQKIQPLSKWLDKRRTIMLRRQQSVDGGVKFIVPQTGFHLIIFFLKLTLYHSEH